MRTRLAILLAAFGAPLFGAYTYYFTDGMQYSQPSYWQANGTVNYNYYSPGGYTGANGGGTLMSKFAVPDGTSSYEVKITMRIPSSGASGFGQFGIVLRGQLSGAGNSYQLTYKPYSQTLTLGKWSGGYFYLLAQNNPTLHDGDTLRAMIKDDGEMAVYINDNFTMYAQDSDITSGLPGVITDVDSGFDVGQVQIGPADRIAPGAVPSGGPTVSVFTNHVDFQWLPVPDDTNGTGIALYQFLSNFMYAANVFTTSWSDYSVQPATEYSYTMMAIDRHFNVSNTTITVTTPPSPGSPPTPTDGRRVGVRSTGTYWGGAAEQIDVLSGNLNYTVPIVKAQARGGWGVGLSMRYNSQNWRQDSGGLWNLGTDVGYGYGWKLLAGSLTPIWANYYTFSYYLYSDSTGAEYRLDQNNGGVWSSTESIYVYYDSNTSKLYFRDGTFWVMGCTSASSEADAGTLYPTTFQDTNGNQIYASYQGGIGVGGTNSSSRISQISEVRGSYFFNYNTDSPPHLTSMNSNFGTAENYQFTYGSQTLQSPFSPYTGYGTTKVLNNIWYNILSAQHYFTYASDNSGALVQANQPGGGALQWNYTSITYGNGRTYREIYQRKLAKDGITFTTYQFGHDSSPGNSTHQYTYIDDPGGVGEKYWAFTQTGTNVGMVSQYQGRDRTLAVSPPAKTQNDFTWRQDSVGKLYLGSTLTTMDPGQTFAVSKKSDQTLDIHGNTTQAFQYDYNSSTPLRIYSYSYLNSSAYTSRYIFNRLTQVQMADARQHVVTLATNTYDAVTFSAPSGYYPYWDSSYSSVSSRGDLTNSVTTNDTKSFGYDQAGLMTGATWIAKVNI